MSERFVRRVEDFTCGHCGVSVQGDGYTNHCPRCLWSRHVDIDPGDRAAECGGLMAPVAVTYEHDAFHITHECIACGHRKRNRTAAEDDLSAFL
ncbi:MAG: RNHCP domain-containing protein [Acidimicrobiia bacterium]